MLVSLTAAFLTLRCIQRLLRQVARGDLACRYLAVIQPLLFLPLFFNIFSEYILANMAETEETFSNYGVMTNRDFNEILIESISKYPYLYHPGLLGKEEKAEKARSLNEVREYLKQEKGIVMTAENLKKKLRNLRDRYIREKRSGETKWAHYKSYKLLEDSCLKKVLKTDSGKNKLSVKSDQDGEIEEIEMIEVSHLMETMDSSQPVEENFAPVKQKIITPEGLVDSEHEITVEDPSNEFSQFSKISYIPINRDQHKLSNPTNEDHTEYSKRFVLPSGKLNNNFRRVGNTIIKLRDDSNNTPTCSTSPSFSKFNGSNFSSIPSPENCFGMQVAGLLERIPQKSRLGVQIEILSILNQAINNMQKHSMDS